MTLAELEARLTRHAVPFSRITPEGSKIDAEGTARKLFDKKSTNKQVVALRLWLGRRADRRHVCWSQQEKRVVLVAEHMMPVMSGSDLLTEGSVDVTEARGLGYILGQEKRKEVDFGESGGSL